MAIAKRVVLFILVNLLVVTVISAILSLFNIRPYLTQHGLDYGSLAIFCLIWGMGGAFISLAMSRMMAKWMMGVQVIDPEKCSGEDKELLQMVYQLAQKAGLPKMPEVGKFESAEPNAFATGPTKSRALVAVSSGLLHTMQRSEIEAVLGHEVTHIANGDMVTMTLLQGIVNAFVMFLARILAYGVSRLFSQKDEGPSPLVNSLMVIVFQIAFMILGSIVIAAFSRYREFRADAGGARLTSRDKMIAALEALKRTQMFQDEHAAQPAFQALKISTPRSGILQLFATHPPLEDRIARLQSRDRY